MPSITNLAVVVCASLVFIGIVNADKSLTTSKTNGVRRSHMAGELIFSDEFDQLDFDKWQHELTMSGGGNWEFQVYWNNRSNSFVKDSILHLKPTLIADRFGEDFVRTGVLSLWGGTPADYCTQNDYYGCERAGAGNNIINPVASARLRTVKSFAFTYGTVEIRAKTPTGDWLWPAMWLLPENQEFGQWPSSGEIDLMESRGNRDLNLDGNNIGVEQVSHTLHYGVDYFMNGFENAHFESQRAAPNSWNMDFHVYKLDWTPDFIAWYIDDVETGRINIGDGGFWDIGQFEAKFPGVANPWAGEHKSAPFNKDFYIILNNAVGGTGGYWPDAAVNGPYPRPWAPGSDHASGEFWDAKDSWYPTWDGENAALQVDYVRVYAL